MSCFLEAFPKTHCRAGDNWALQIKDQDLSRESGHQGYGQRCRAQYSAYSQMYGIDASQIEGHILSGHRVWSRIVVHLDRCAVNSLRSKARVHLLLTLPTSSPGTARTRSPTWTRPEHSLPDTATPEATAVCPLNTLETGMRKGLAYGLSGTSTLSDCKRSRRRFIPTQGLYQGRAGVP